MEHIIAIDVGNGFGKSAIVLDPSKDPLLLTPPHMPLGLPSIAHVAPDGTIHVGAGIHPGCAQVRDVKVHLDKEALQLNAGGTTFTVAPSKIYGAVALELIRLANQSLAERGLAPSYRVVVTYPSSFIDTPKPGIMKRSIEALELNGHRLEVVAMLPEPVAAGVDTLYYERNIKADANTDQHYNITVYDLGHGTLDVAVITSTNDKAKPFDLICQTGDPDVGGRVFDEKIFRELCRQLGSTPTGQDYRQLRFDHAVNMKHELSNAHTSVSCVNFLLDGNEEYTELELTKASFEHMILTDIRNTMVSVAQMLETAQKKGVAIQEIVLTGGASQIPLIQRLLEDTFGDAQLRVRQFRPPHAVVGGAARYAFDLQAKPITQYTEYAYGIYGDSDDKVYMLIPAGAALTAGSTPLIMWPNSSDTRIRICRSKDRLCTDQTLPYRQCNEIRRFHFVCQSGRKHEVAITIDEDHRLTVQCKLPDGSTLSQSTFDQQEEA